MSNDEKKTDSKKTRKALPRTKEIKNTTESKKVNGGEHPTATFVKTYDMRCLR